MNKLKHELVITVLADEPCGQRQMQNTVHNWLETFGHTASSHGFEFVSVGVMTGKRLKGAPSLSNKREVPMR